MAYLFKLIVLCAMCEYCFAKVTYFDWQGFKAIKSDIVNFDMRLAEVENARGQFVKYPSGTLTFKQPIDKSVQIHYVLRSPDGEKFDEVHQVCDHTFYQNYLLPITANSDYKASDKCPTEPNKVTFKKVENFRELVGNTKLSNNKYSIQVTYLDNGTIIGGFRGAFSCRAA